MPDPRGGKAYVPLDLRRQKKGHQPFVFMLDEEEEPPCVTFSIFAPQAHVEIKFDEASLDDLFEAVFKHRIEVAKRLAYQRGAASAMRKKR